MTTWSCTPFFGEAGVLEIRLAALDAVVDRHVLVEALVTHSGWPRKLVFPVIRERFAEWAHKISYVVATGLPTDPAASWAREHQHRDACIRGMDNLADDDLVFLSDVDEIPDPTVFEVADPSDGPVWVGMAMHLYRLNWRWPELPVAGGTRATFATGAQLRESAASVLVEQQTSHLPGCWGWHLAYQGGVEAIQAKLAALADFPAGGGELADRWQDRWATREHLERCIATGADLFDRGHRQCEWVGMEALPPCVQAHPRRFAHMLAPEPSQVAA